MKNETFEFKVQKPINGVQYVQIYATYPNMTYPVSLYSYNLDPKENIEIGIMKLKVELIKEIVNAKFKYE